MNDKDLEIQRLRQDVAKWKNRALEACGNACVECVKTMPAMDGKCAECRIKQIRDEATRA